MTTPDPLLSGRPSMVEFAGGSPAFLALATAFHRRCLEDPVLAHPVSHPGNPHHIERLADYWAKVFGGPPGPRSPSAATQRCSASTPARKQTRSLGSDSWPASSRPLTTPLFRTTPSSVAAFATT